MYGRRRDLSRTGLTGRGLLNRIAEEFGPQSIRPDGELNRKSLGKLVFDDPRALEKLNEITHPAILQATNKKLSDAVHEGYRWGVFEAAILVEGESYRDMDFLVVVSAPKTIRLERVMERDGLSRAQALARIEAQAP